MKLILKNVTFERDFHTIFQKISAELAAGQVLQIQGSNGSGKTTLLRLIAGFGEATDGSIIWNGESILTQREAYQSQIAYLGHQNGFKPFLTTKENLKLLCALKKISFETTKIENMLEKMNLRHLMTVQVRKLSAGQKRRLSFAGLLLQEKPLWILDEPLTAVDQEGQTIFNELLSNHCGQNGMAVIATHQLLSLAVEGSRVSSINIKHVNRDLHV